MELDLNWFIERFSALCMVYSSLTNEKPLMKELYEAAMLQSIGC